MEQPQEQPRGKRKLPFIIGGIVVLILAVFFLYNKPSPPGLSAYHSPQIALLRVEVQDGTPGVKILKGWIRNISDHKFADIRVYVSWYTDKGEFVKSGDGIVEYRPLMAGQKCEFEVRVESNPMMEQYKIQFRDRDTNWIIPYEMRTTTNAR